MCLTIFMAQKGIPLTEEHKKKIAETIRQRHMLGLQPKIERCLVCKRFVHPNQTCEELNQQVREKKLANPTRYWLGKKRDKKTCEAISKAQSTREHTKGIESPCWVGGWMWYHKQAREIMEGQIGRKLNRKEIIHHIDKNWKNNDLKNLQIMSRAEHVRIHKPRLKNN
jgi:hypothetical protein